MKSGNQATPEVVIVASAFGMDAVRRDGHRAWLAIAANAGAAGFEVRRELFSSEAQASTEALNELGQAIAHADMWPVYSTPDALYCPDGTLDSSALERALREATALGARFVKLQLGGFIEHAAAAQIADRLRGATVRLVVENGQLKEGGSLAQFVALFEALAREGHERLLGMTFDMGNWRWPGEVPLDAAPLLARYVEYIHCKAVVGEGMRLFAVAPEPDDAQCAALFALLPGDVPRGIEFPFEASRLADDAARYVAWLATR